MSQHTMTVDEYRAEVRRRKASGSAVDFLALWRRLADGWPEPVAELRFHDRRRWRFDWAWEYEPDLETGGALPLRIALEVDGGRWAPGGGRHATDADREKLNHAASAGWLVLRVSPQQLRRDPRGIVSMLQAAIARRRREWVTGGGR